MAQFSVKTNNTKSTIETENDLARELANIESEIRGVRNSLGFQVASKANIQTRLNNTANKVSEHKAGMNIMSAALQNTVNRYEHAENTIIGNINVGNAKIQNVSGDYDVSGGYDESKEEKKESKYLDVLWKAVGAFGAGGKVVSTVGKFLTSDKEPAAKWAGLFYDGWKTGWKIGDAVEKCKENTNVKWWKELFGINSDSVLTSIPKTNTDWKSRAVQGWGKKVDKSVEELKTVKGVGTIALSGIKNAVSNYKEYMDSGGKMSVGRAVAETVTETAVDWGKDLMIGAAVTAGFAAAGVAAPVFMVGGATVLISAGVDWVSEKVTGKKLTEAASDFILDTVETGAKKVKEKATALWNGISSGWKTLTGGKKNWQPAW